MVFDFGKPINVLVVEDEQVCAQLLEGALKRSNLCISQIECCNSLEGTLEALGRNGFQVILLDLNLADSEGLSTLEEIQGRFGEVAKVVITGEYDEELGFKALACGAEDYLIKGRFDVYTLSKSVAYSIERKRMEKEQQGLIEKLQRVNEELGNFAYIVSHDLKAPLRAIGTLSEWILADYGDKLGEEGGEKVGLLQKRARRMQEMIDGILAYSRIDRTEQKRISVDLNVVLREAIEAVAPPENVEVAAVRRLPTVECDPTRMVQVFQNLIGNAVKYMDKAEGLIQIECEAEDGFWKFSVSDNGCGIEAKDLERIFQIFQKASSYDDGASTGIGLTLVKKIVELYGGSIRVESEKGKGSTFFFTVPRQESEVLCDA